MKRKSFQHPLSGIFHRKYTWCLHCESAYKTEKWVENEWECPRKDCDGGVMDAFSWTPDDWPLSCNPDYPHDPVEGKYYPLYGKNFKNPDE
jgi:hypothetical protein